MTPKLIQHTKRTMIEIKIRATGFELTVKTSLAWLLAAAVGISQLCTYFLRLTP